MYCGPQFIELRPTNFMVALIERFVFPSVTGRL